MPEPLTLRVPPPKDGEDGDENGDTGPDTDATVSPIFDDTRFFVRMLNHVDRAEHYHRSLLEELDALRDIIYARAHYRFGASHNLIAQARGQDVEEVEAMCERGLSLLR